MTAKADCDSADLTEVRGCRALSVAIRQGDDEFSIGRARTLLFRNDRTAESELENVEEGLETLLAPAEESTEVVQDGPFVLVNTSTDGEDFNNALEAGMAVPEISAEELGEDSAITLPRLWKNGVGSRWSSTERP